MADAQALRELADEVEGLPGPSRQTDPRIERAVHGSVPLHWAARGGVITDGLDDRNDFIARYTGSIDDAAKLMPPGWSGKVEFSAQRVVAHAWHAEHRGVRVEARTEPLARTACALRALAADLEGKTDATV